MARGRYSDDYYSYSYSPRGKKGNGKGKGGNDRGRGNARGRRAYDSYYSDEYSVSPRPGRKPALKKGNPSKGNGRKRAGDVSESSSEGFWAGAANALGFGGSKKDGRKKDKYGASDALDQNTRGNREDFSWGNVFSLGGAPSDSDTSSGDDRRPWQFPRKPELKAQLLNDEEIQTRAPWVRRMVVDNVLHVFAGKTMTRKTAKKRMNKRIIELKADPENADLYNDQPYLVRKAIDAGIPSVRNVVLEKVWAMGRPAPGADVESEEDEMLMTARTRRRQERKEDIRDKVDTEVIPAVQRKISRVVGYDVDIVIDWDSFGNAPDAFDPLDGHGGQLLFDVLYKEFRETFDTTPGQVVCPIEVVNVKLGAPTEVLDKHGTLTISSPFHHREKSAAHILALNSIRHSIAVSTLPPFHELAMDQFMKVTKMVREATRMMQVETGSLKYFDWLLQQPCFWAPVDDRANVAIEAARRRIGEGEKILKEWIAFKVSRRDREEERVVVVTTDAVYLFKIVNGHYIPRPVEKQRIELSAIDSVVLAPFRAEGSVGLSGRQALYQTQYGVRLNIRSPTRPEITIRGMPPAVSAPGSKVASNPKTARVAEKSQAYEIAEIICMAKRMATNQFRGKHEPDTDGAIVRTASFGSGWSAAGWNRSHKGAIIHK